MVPTRRFFRVAVLCVATVSPSAALQFSNPFASKASKVSTNPLPTLPSTTAQKQAVLDAVSFTTNGKTATPEQQATALQVVRTLETQAPPAADLLTNPEQAKIVAGTWYLQYTSPSAVGDADNFPDAWKPENTDAEAPTFDEKKFKAQGSVSAAGIKVDTSNRVVKQSFDIVNSRVVNDIALDWGDICVAGGFRSSDQVPNRSIVSFDTCEITVSGVKLNLNFLFGILAIVRRTKDLGWLETTFCDAEMRIGRGNKGTMFVLTRDPAAVKP